MVPASLWRSSHAFPNGLSQDPGAKKPLRLYRNPSYAAYPDRALPRSTLLRASSGRRWRRAVAAVGRKSGWVFPVLGKISSHMCSQSSDQAHSESTPQ